MKEEVNVSLENVHRRTAKAPHLSESLMRNGFSTDNDPPAFVSDPGLQAGAGSVYRYDAAALDPDRGDGLAFSLLEAPAGMTINQLSGQIRWRPGLLDLGSHAVTVQTSDLAGAEAVQSYTLTVGESAVLRVSSQPPSRVVAGTSLSYQPQVEPGGQSNLAFELLYGPTGMQIDPLEGTLTWLTVQEDLGRVVAIAFRVVDQQGNSALQSFLLVVDLPPQPPQIVSTPLTGRVRSSGPRDGGTTICTGRSELWNTLRAPLPTTTSSRASSSSPLSTSIICGPATTTPARGVSWGRILSEAWIGSR